MSTVDLLDIAILGTHVIRVVLDQWFSTFLTHGLFSNRLYIRGLTLLFPNVFDTAG